MQHMDRTHNIVYIHALCFRFCDCPAPIHAHLATASRYFRDSGFQRTLGIDIEGPDGHTWVSMRNGPKLGSDIGVCYSRYLDTGPEASETSSEHARPGTPVWMRSTEARRRSISKRPEHQPQKTRQTGSNVEAYPLWLIRSVCSFSSTKYIVKAIGCIESIHGNQESYIMAQRQVLQGIRTKCCRVPPNDQRKNYHMKTRMGNM